VKLTLEKPVYGGDCLARADGGGKAIFVSLGLPGETVLAHVIEEKKSFAKAELDEILSSSPNRVEAWCWHFGSCGGCHLQHADYVTQLRMKEQVLREMLARAGVAIPAEIGVLAGEPWGYRNRIRLAVTGDGRIGYRGRRSHEVVPVVECPIAAPGLLKVAEAAREFLGSEIAPAAIVEIEIFGNADESRMLVTLFSADAPANEAEVWLERLRAVWPESVRGVRMVLSDGGLNPKTLASVGEGSISYETAGFGYQVEFGAFFQVNRWLVDGLVGLVTKGRSGGLAWDLFAGVGLFARRLAGTFERVVAAEVAPASLAALERNLAGVGGARAVESTTLDFLRRNREERQPRPDFVVLDPPRAGLGQETTTLLSAIHAPEMVYVSCDPATLARDLRALTTERYRVESVTLVDMFPQTFHIETVVGLARS